MVAACLPLTLRLLLTLSLTHLLTSGYVNGSVDPTDSSVSSQATGQPPGAATSDMGRATNSSEDLGSWTISASARFMKGVTSEHKESTSMETSTDVVTINPRMTMKATSRMTSRVAPKTTSRMTPKTTSRMTLKTTSRMTLKTTSRMTQKTTFRPILSMASSMKTKQRASVYETGPSSQVGIILFLSLLLITLLILLVSACRKLQGFGGQGSYYPCRLDRERYVNAEGGEGTVYGRPRSMGQVFLTAVHRLLPWRSSALLNNEEEEEENEDEEGKEGEGEEGMEDDEVPGGGDSKAWPEGEVEGDSVQDDTDHSDSDDYSSLGGLDLRERAALKEEVESEEEGQAEGSEGSQSEDNLPDPPSPGGDDLLSDIHSFSGTAQWSDTSHDITAL
ncbi:uncharacterized protein LOC125449613 [Stegostoma tigrinum]|uniref:uncharacterized protein LOC125449613 n=1 Tax=Stegostoma tigrinum TaxID=3053191 RepID=UPI00202AE37F|nr:uncharacterized protein LOC125449613 [Stegostoma tigrinum]